MRDFFKKFCFYKQVLTLDSQYTDVPSGDVDIDRLLAGKSAFLDLATESELLKRRKLLLGSLSDSDFLFGLSSFLRRKAINFTVFSQTPILVN